MNLRWMIIGLLALGGCGAQAQPGAARPTVTVAPTSAPPLPATAPPQVEPSTASAETPFASPPAILSAGETSPDGRYQVRYGPRIEYPEIQIFDAAGALISADLAEANHEAIGYNTKIGCQCATKIAGWVGPHAFLLRINTGEGKSYGYIVDAASAKVDQATFMELELPK